MNIKINRIVLFCLLFVVCMQTIIIHRTIKNSNKEYDAMPMLSQSETTIDSCYLLALSCAMVESSLQPTKQVKSTKAVGFLQIRPIKVAEVNRILNLKNKTKNKKYYNLQDRWDINKSIEMFRIEMEHKNRKLNVGKCVRLWYGANNRDYYNKVLNNYTLLLYYAKHQNHKHY